MAARLRIVVSDQVLDMVDLVPGIRFIVGRAPTVGDGERGIVIPIDGVSRNHLSVELTREGVTVRDLDSTLHTFHRSVAIAQQSVKDREQAFVLGPGLATVLIAPPLGDGTHHQARTLAITGPTLRNQLTALCRDHLIHPTARGVWTLTVDELALLLKGSDGSGPKPHTIRGAIKTMREAAHRASGILPADTTELIDWAISTREVTQADAALLDEHLRKRCGRPYDEIVLELPRAEFLRRLRLDQNV